MPGVLGGLALMMAQKALHVHALRDLILTQSFMIDHYRHALFTILRERPPVELKFATDGFLFRIPWSFAVLYFARPFHATVGRWITEHLRPGAIAVDVGAHLGYFTLLMTHRVGSEGHVYAVEPAEDNLRFLSANVRENRVDNVTVIPAAAGKTSRRREFLLKSSSARHGFYPDPDPRIQTTGIVSVREVPLDEVISGPVDLVKIDAEGAELEVLEGMSRIFHECPHLSLVVEWNPKFLAQAGHTIDALPQYIHSRGFAVSVLDHGAGNICTVDEVLARASSLSQSWYGELLCERHGG